MSAMRKFNTNGTCFPDLHDMSFCFNKAKDPGLGNPVHIGNRTLVEVVV